VDARVWSEFPVELGSARFHRPVPSEAEGSGDGSYLVLAGIYFSPLNNYRICILNLVRISAFGFRALKRLTIVLLGVALSTVGNGAEPTFDDQALEFFEREVRPVLSDRCYACHSGRLKEPKGGLRLDSRSGLLAGGDTGPAIVPGDTSASLLVDAVNYGDLYQMPPKTKLPAHEIKILTQWIRMGAPWGTSPDVANATEFDLKGRMSEHWCWTAPTPVDPPAVRNRDWPRQESDAFILAALENRGLTPAAQANRRVLVRRAYFDLIGLPPTPEQVEAFLRDDSSGAFETLVDELLDSPHFGERWARHWLDLVRYAETYGHEFDYMNEHAYKYRDYLIRAFNADISYDQLILEHVAGDLLEPARRHPAEDFNESVIGTGFWWLGEATHSPVDVRDDEARRADNQIDVLCKTFLGLTVACARCHDHKFDAISTKDYYALAGYLQSSRRHEAFLDPRGSIKQSIRRMRRLTAQGTERLVVSLLAKRLSADEFAERLVATWGLDASVEKEGSLARWVTALRDDQLKDAAHPLHAWFLLSERGGAAPADIDAVSRRLEAAAAEAERVNSALPRIAEFEAGFDDWFVTGHAFGQSPTLSSQWDAWAEEVQLQRPGLADGRTMAGPLQGVLRSPTFTLTHPNVFYRISGKGATVRVIAEGYFMDTFNALLFKGFSLDVDTEGQFIWQRQAQDLHRYVGHRVHLEIIDHGDGAVGVDEVRLSDGEIPRTPPSKMARAVVSGDVQGLPELARAYGRCWAAAFEAIEQHNANAEDVALINWALKHGLIADAPRDAELDSLREQLKLEELGLAAPNRVLAMVDGTPENERVFIRGNHRTLGDEVPRRFLTALAGNAGVSDRGERSEPGQNLQQESLQLGSGRLALAREMIEPNNPLVARVMVNRIWHHLFGRGIVPSVDNFGVLGQRPTNPELLDYLALRFVGTNWSIKRIIRELMLSATYQMSSKAAANAAEIDPQNLLWHHMPIRRLQGESIRDAMLCLSGGLDRTMYGRSVPIHVTPFMQGRGRPKKSGPLNGNGRRSVYLEVRRNFLSPMMLAFDTPIPFNTIGRRNQSNVPAQALILMNDPFVVEQAKKWSERLVAQPSTPKARIEHMYQATFSRPPTELELRDSRSFLDRQASELATGLEDPRVWADLAHVLWNVKEFIYLK
jgi:hypothetical protein